MRLCVCSGTLGISLALSSNWRGRCSGLVLAGAGDGGGGTDPCAGCDCAGCAAGAGCGTAVAGAGPPAAALAAMFCCVARAMFGVRPIGRAGIEIVWPPSSTLTSPARSCSSGMTAALPSGSSRARSSLVPTAMSTPPMTESAAVSAMMLRPLVICPSCAICLLASPAPPMND